MRLYPEWYRFNRMPFILEDSSAIIQGFTTSLRLRNNYVVDSIHNNFHTNMPDTTTVTPYSSISVGGPRVTISYENGVVGMELGRAKIVPYTLEGMRKDSLRFMSGDTMARGAYMFYREPEPQFRDTFYVRLTLNGRLLYDWKPLPSLPATFCKGTETYVLRGEQKYPPMPFTGYGYEYLICDTTLNVHDQLLVEIKESRRNWMVGRYNFTRVATAPQADALRITSEDGRTAFVPLQEKKTLASAPVTRTSR
ncbi:hypothetical protein [Dinghuibacter silviterrae]|nr:hypothetical protein [Dinghuibacter silviterrae]